MEDGIKAEIDQLKERNRRVEADKAWETSNMRKIVIAVVTYLLAAFILFQINAPAPFANALIPTAGFLLSTMTFAYFKNWWIRNRYEKRKI